MQMQVFISVPVWNSLGYIKSKPTDCGHEYQIGTVWPATWSYNISSIGVSENPNHMLQSHMCIELLLLKLGTLI